jgi:DNA-binding transcriptional LysR family regulator
MELRRLRYFLKIAADGSLNRASASLGIAQPALGRQMQLLEGELGVQLFQRVAKGMRLTEEGDYLREALTHPLERIDAALQDIRTFSTRTEASCVLGLPPAMARALGPRLYRRFAAEMPNLRLTLVEYDSSELMTGLLRGHIDLALIAGLMPDERLFHRELLSEPLLLVGAPDSPLADKASVAFAELADYPLIVPPKPAVLGTTLEKLAARVTTRINLALEISSPEVAKELVASGSGYAVFSPLACKAERDAGKLIGLPIVQPELRQTVYTVTQAHWRIPRSTYNQFHGLFYEEVIGAVDSGEWDAQWIADPQQTLENRA